MEPRPVHAGIIVIRQRPLMTDDEARSAIEALVRSAIDLTNMLYRWRRPEGWIRDIPSEMSRR